MNSNSLIPIFPFYLETNKVYQSPPTLLLCILSIMSFRFNLSHREPSDRSFMLQGNELVATSIGLTANRTMLSCVMNMDGKDYRYYKSDAEIL